MSWLEKWETRIERSVNRLFLRSGKNPVQPIEIIEAVRNALNAAARPVGVNETVLIPHHYYVHLAPADYDRFHSAEAMTPIKSELAKYIARQAYRLSDELLLELLSDTDLLQGSVRVEAAETPEGVLWQPLLRFGPNRIELSYGSTTVGRSAGGADVTVADTGLSRKHFDIAWNGQVAAVRDLQSTNGTYLNGARISEAVLRTGDTILAGRTEFLFELQAKAVS